MGAEEALRQPPQPAGRYPRGQAPTPSHSRTSSLSDSSESEERVQMLTEPMPNSMPGDSHKEVPAVDLVSRVKHLIDVPLVEGAQYFLISQKWSKKFTYLGEEAPAIDNSDLLSNNGKLRPFLSETWDFDIVPAAAWELMHTHFGGGPQIMRRCISRGELGRTEFVVEVYPYELELRAIQQRESGHGIMFFGQGTDEAPAGFEPKQIVQISAEDSLRTLRCRASEVFGIDESRLRVWQSEAHYTYTPYKRTLRPGTLLDSADEMDETLTDLSILADEPVFIEVMDRDGRFRVDEAGKSTSAGKLGSVDEVGATGLANLGNTCFMNSTLQCLSHSQPLVEHFTSGAHCAEINKTNVLGTGGRLATAFGSVMSNLWSGRYSDVKPGKFKTVLGNFAPQFSGYEQHDSQELLTFLLDGLHEDLNRVVDKPCTETIEAADMDATEASLKAWQQHKSRNDSAIVDLYHGQYRSTVKCDDPTCGKVSVTFDPYLCLSLPIGNYSKGRTLDVFVHADARWITVTVAKLGNIIDLKHAISNATRVISRNIQVAAVTSNSMTLYNDADEIVSIGDRQTLAAFEVPSKLLESNKIQLLLHRVRRTVTRKRTSYYSGVTTYEDVEEDDFEGMATALLVPRSVTGARLHELVRQALDSAGHPKEGFDLLHGYWHEKEYEYSVYDAVTKRTTWRTKTKRQWAEDSISDDAATMWHDGQGDPEFIVVNWKKDVLDKGQLLVEPRPARAELPPVSLDACIESFLETERLSESDAWYRLPPCAHTSARTHATTHARTQPRTHARTHATTHASRYCPQCKEHRQAFKKFDVWTLPELLVVQLKRFNFNNHSRDKIEALVDFPIDGLDLAQYVKTAPDGSIYDLYAVSNHMGGLNGGHYTAYAKNPTSAQWYSFNDSWVSKVQDAESIKSSAAYMLFYRRRQPTAAIKVPDTNAAEARADLDLAATYSTNEPLSSSPTDTARAFDDNAALPSLFPFEPNADDAIRRSASDPISAAA